MNVKQQQIIALYGVPAKPLSYAEISKKVGCSKAWVFETIKKWKKENGTNKKT